jgi:hypothetical protein
VEKENIGTLKMNDTDSKRLVVMEFNPELNEVLLSANQHGFDDLIDEFKHRKNYFDHIELMAATDDLSQDAASPSNQIITWFQINHVEKDPTMSHVLCFEVSPPGLICCVDNTGIDIMVEALTSLTQEGAKEVRLSRENGLSSVYKPDPDYQEVATLCLVNLQTKKLG